MRMPNAIPYSRPKILYSPAPKANPRMALNNTSQGKEKWFKPRAAHLRCVPICVQHFCTTCVQEGGLEGSENGPKQRRINNSLLSYRPFKTAWRTAHNNRSAISRFCLCSKSV